MDGVLGSPDDPKYMDLANKALDIYLRDLPDITMAEERHVVTFNTHYWKGYASVDNPYVAPYSLWAGFILTLFNVEKAGA